MCLKKEKEKNQSIFFKRPLQSSFPRDTIYLIASYLHGLARRMIPSLIDFLDVVACDTELHFLDRVSRVAANVIFFLFFFSPVFFPLFFFLFHRLEQTVDGTRSDRNGRKSKRRPERCRGRERPSKKKKKKKMPMSMMDAWSRGHFLKLFKNRVFRANNALNGVSPGQAVIGSRYFNTGPRTLEGHNPRAWLNSTLIRQTHTSWSERTVNWHRVNRTPVESYENIDWRCGVPRICLRFLCTCDKYTVRSRLFRIVS